MLRATAESIQAAKDAQRQEREAVFQQTGIRIREDGSIQPKVIVGSCSKCGFQVSALTQGRVVRSLACHIVAKHRPQKES